MPQRGCPRESPWLQSLYLLSRTGQIPGGECSEGLGDRKAEENEDTVLGVRPPMVVGVWVLGMSELAEQIGDPIRAQLAGLPATYSASISGVPTTGLVLPAELNTKSLQPKAFSKTHIWGRLGGLVG